MPKKKKDDITVNRETGKRTLSGAEANRRASNNNKAIGAITSRKKTYTESDLLFGISNFSDKGGYSLPAIKSSKLPVSSGGKRAGNSYLNEARYIPAGTRTKRERGR